eukprot:gene9073-6366_t
MSYADEGCALLLTASIHPLLLGIRPSEFSPAAVRAEPKQPLESDTVVLNRVAVPDNVANNENLMIDLLGEDDDLLDENGYYWEDHTSQQGTKQGAYWGQGPGVPMVHYSLRHLGDKSVCASTGEFNEEGLPPSSVQSAVDLNHDFDDQWESSSSDSLDSEQIRWVEEQLVAGNQKTDGYFR